MRARLLAACLALGVARCAAPTPPAPTPTSAPSPVPSPSPELPASLPSDASNDDASEPASPADAASDEAAAPQRYTGPRHCRSEVWGGWRGTPECRVRAARVVPAKHKPCELDSDCVMVGAACTPHAVSAKFEKVYEEVYACGNPAAGQCASRWHAACVEGCCDLVGNW